MRPRDQRLARITRRTLHHVGLGRLPHERHGGQDVGHEVDPQDLQGGQRAGQAGDDRRENDQDLRQVAGEEEVDHLAQVAVDDAALPHRADDGGEVVIDEHDVRRGPGHVGAVSSHRDADVGAGQGRRVVHAVAGHGDDLAPSLQRRDQLELAFRRHPAADRLGCETELASDRLGRGALIARQHHDRDAGLLAAGDRVAHAGTQRIDERDEAQGT